MIVRTLAAGTVLAAALAAPALTQELRPFQQAALDRVLASYSAEERALMGPQLQMMFAEMDEATITMMVAAMIAEADGGGDEGYYDDDIAYGEATNEDLAFNRAQFEPVARGYFEIGRRFNEFVDGVVARQGEIGTHAVWGQAWRYELSAPSPFKLDFGPDASFYLQRIEMMAPQDGRYRFDLPAAPASFDETGVEAAIREGFAAYNTLGARFSQQIRTLTAANRFDEAHALEQTARAEASEIERAMNERLAALAPQDRGEFMTALAEATQLN